MSYHNGSRRFGSTKCLRLENQVVRVYLRDFAHSTVDEDTSRVGCNTMSTDNDF